MEFVVYLIGVAFLFAYLARDDGRCHVCGAPANAQRHASECPWGDPPYAQTNEVKNA